MRRGIFSKRDSRGRRGNPDPFSPSIDSGIPNWRRPARSDAVPRRVDAEGDGKASLVATTNVSVGGRG